MIWNKNRESLDREDLEGIQLKSLQVLLEKIYSNVPFYRKKFDKAGVKPGDLKSLADLGKFPFTTKDELRDTYPFGLLALPKEEIVEVHTSSGTTGIPVLGAYSRGDIELWSECMARTLAAAGAGPGDIIQNAYGYGLFTGGLGVHYGARKLGLCVIPISAGNTKRQLMVMKDFQATILACTPSYALYMAEAAREEGFDLRELSLKSGIFGAEPWSESMREEIKKALNIKAHDIYGLTEIIGPGVACECENNDGLHIQEDLFYPEIVDPATGEVLPEGKPGELVLTTLTKEGTPLLRYKTRDITYLMREPCPCGRTLTRMHRLLGRTDDMIIIRGVNLFPSQIEQVLLNIEGTLPHYQIIIDRSRAWLDELEVDVEVDSSIFSDETKRLEELRDLISSELKTTLGVQAKVRLVEPKTLARSEGKAKRILDKRQI